MTKELIQIWIARLLILAVFLVNAYCALIFILFPDSSTSAYELSGVVGRTSLQGIGVAFLMWNATYPLVILKPKKHRVLFLVVILQQVIGLVGESWIFIQLPDGHQLLRMGIMRFIVFDFTGLIFLIIAFILTSRLTSRKALSERATRNS
jgi:hypothetical protein